MDRHAKIKRLKHSIERTKQKIANYGARKPHLSKWGMWSLGYQEGRLSVLEDLLDEMKEQKED